jgi:membrane protein YqaA with SNARE-associated domain
MSVEAMPAPKKGPIGRLYDWSMKWAGTKYAVPALFLMSFAEASFFPIPPDVLLLPLCFGAREKSFKFAFWCLCGSVLGGVLGYYIGFALWESLHDFFIPRFFSQVKFDTVSKTYVDNAFLVIAAKGLTPIPYKLVTISAGVAKVPFAIFMTASVVCRAPRFFIVAGLVYFFGEKVRPFIEKYLTWLLLAVLVVVIAGFLIFKR